MPVALSTDDEGVSRIDLTHEYVRAVETFGLSYADLKQLVRNSLEYSFLPGAEPVGRQRRLCARRARLPGRCARLRRAVGGVRGLLAREREGQEQWELERRFQAFEASL